MNNWRLLLLAVVVVVQPIGSFTESNLFDGRECCVRSTTREDRLDGTYKTNEDRRLNSLDRDHGNRRDARLTSERSSFDTNERRISPEQRRATNEDRIARNHEHRHRIATEARELREHREVYNRNRDVLRSSVVQNERDSFESRNREFLDVSRTVKHMRDLTNANTAAERESRIRMFRLPIRTSRANEDRRVSSNRQIETAFIREREAVARSYLQRDTIYHRSERRIGKEDRRADSDRLSRNKSVLSRYEIRANTADRLVSRRPATGMDVRNPSEERRQQREVRDIQRMQGPRNNVARDARRTIAERRPQRENRDNTGRIQNSLRPAIRKDAKRFSEEQRQQREGQDTRMHESRRTVLRVDTIAELRQQRENRDNAERMQASLRPAVRIDARTSVELREQREVRDSTERVLESRRSANRMDVRISSEERRQQREVRVRELQEPGRTVARVDIRKTNADQRRQHENRDSMERMQRSLRSTVRTDARASEERRQQREVRAIERMQEQRRNVGRVDARETVAKQTQQRENRENAERMQESLRFAVHVRSLEERRQAREVRDSTGSIQESVRSGIRIEARGSSEERRQQREVRGTERMQERRRTVVRADRETFAVQRQHREIRERTDRIQESRRSAVQMDVNTSEARSRQNIRENNTPDLGRHALERSMELRQRTNSYTRNINNAEKRGISRDTRTIQNQLERVVRNVRETELTNRRNNERIVDGRRQVNREAIQVPELRREVRMGEILDSRRHRNIHSRSTERILSERKPDTLTITRESSKVRDVQSPGKIRIATDRLLAERRQENRQADRASRITGEELRMNERLNTRQRDSKESRAFRESRHENQLLPRNIPVSTTTSETRGERAMRNIERQVNDRNSRLNRQESRKSLESRVKNENLEFMNRGNTFIRNVRDGKAKQDERSFRKIDSGTFSNALDSEESSDSAINNWQMLFYTLQVVYLSGFLVQMLAESTNSTKKRTFNLWTSPNLMKVD